MDDAWYFKPNAGDGVFGAQQRVAQRPKRLVGGHAFGDFDRDGNPNLVVLHGRRAGYCSYDRDNSSWSAFRPFAASPNVGSSERLSWLDVSGDGRPDLVVAHDDRLTIFESKGEEGFGPPVDVALNRGEAGAAPTVRQDGALDLFFLDMTGDGAQDLVQIQNGRVEYWPQLGHGRFGSGIVMEDAPHFEDHAEFDGSRLRFVDLDGSGTTDCIYIGGGEVRTWINASGNRFVEGTRLVGLPYQNLSFF